MVTLTELNQKDVLVIADNNGNPDWVREIRSKTFSQYLSLPYEISPLYTKYSDANKLDANNIQIDLDKKSPKPYSELKDRIDHLEKNCSFVFLDSQLNQQYVSEKVSEKRIVISEINEAFVKYPELVKKYLENNSYVDDKFLALSASSFQTGLFVYVPKDTVIEEPIRVINSLTGSDSAISRNLFVIEPNSIVTIMQEIYSNNNYEGPQRSLFEFSECHVAPNSNLELITLQALGSNTANFSNRKAFIKNDGKISWYLGLFGSDLSRYKTDSYLNGQGASSEDVGIIFGASNQSFDISSNLIHLARNSRGRTLFKGVMKDSSKSLFKGMIKIGKDAKSSESYLAGHSILLDKGAKSDAIPGLEIETNEVKATHSASVSQIDESQIFYLMSRGLTREGAKREIVNGFLEPLSRKMGPVIRAYVNYLIENKWQGKSLMLRTDEAMEQILEVEKSRYRETEDIFEKHYKYR